MKKTLLEYGIKLAKATREGNLNWERVDDTSCLTTIYEKKGFIICRYAFESGKQVISFNFLDENNSVPNNEFNNWQEVDENFNSLNELYDLALQTTPITA
jgi:hypothetical protein